MNRNPTINPSRRLVICAKIGQPYCIKKHPIALGRPYAATKIGALRDEIASLRSNIAEYGHDERFEEENGPTLGEQLKTALAAQKRQRKST